MAGPLLALDHDWHRARDLARHGQGRPPPLVAAGFDVAADAGGRRVVPGGLAVIFGIFPATLADFEQLARAQLHLTPEQAAPLAGVLATRLMAVWAWLPTRRADAYAEWDRATGELGLWLLSEDGCRVLDPERDDLELDEAFLDALVLNGQAHWGGTAGLARLHQRFGDQPLLVAAQVADALDRHPREPGRALELARQAWPDLDAGDELPWAELVDAVHPFTAVQIGTLALRLGLLRAARALLAQAGAAEASPLALFNLGQACEALDDHAAAANAFAAFAAGHPQDPDGWRRLLFCRLRLGHEALADEALANHRSAGGEDASLVARASLLLGRDRLDAEARVRLAGCLARRLPAALASRLPLTAVVEHVERRRGAEAARHLAAHLGLARMALAEDGLTPAAGEAVLYAAVLALPLIGAPTAVDGRRTAAAWAAIALRAVNACREPAGAPRLPAPPAWLFDLAGEALRRG